jgi:hypothetical protein
VRELGAAAGRRGSVQSQKRRAGNHGSIFAKWRPNWKWSGGRSGLRSSRLRKGRRRRRRNRGRSRCRPHWFDGPYAGRGRWGRPCFSGLSFSGLGLGLGNGDFGNRNFGSGRFGNRCFVGFGFDRLGFGDLGFDELCDGAGRVLGGDGSCGLWGRRWSRLWGRGLRRCGWSQSASAHAAEAVGFRVRVSAAGTAHGFPSTIAYDILGTG